MGEVELFKNALKAGLIEDPSAERLEEQELEEQRPEEQGKNGSEPDRVVEQEAPALIEALILASGEGLSQERI
ncbi:MAG: hypothetical protein GX589_00865, partial [Deltaproteobacteria bacterium]|nr:hypothetical protein [Deltaproteobacteria bacterium]